MRRAFGMFFLRSPFIFGFTCLDGVFRYLPVRPKIIIALCILLLQVKKKVDENVEIWYHINIE